MAYRVDREHNECEPDDNESDPARSRHGVAEDCDTEGENKYRRDVLQQSSIESGSRVAAAPNASSGIAVIGPSNSSIRLIPMPPSMNAAANELSK